MSLNLFRKLCDLIFNAGNLVEATLRQLRLPIEVRNLRKIQQKEIQERISLLQSGALLQTKSKLTEKIIELLPEFYGYLQSDEGHKQVLKWKKSSLEAEQQIPFNAKLVKDFLNQRISKVICTCNGFEELCNWANTTFAEDATKLLKSLHMLDLDVRGESRPVSGMTITGKDLKSDDNSFAKDLSSLAVSLLCSANIVAFPIYGVIKLVESRKEATFRATLERAFNMFLQENEAPDFQLLCKMVLSLLESFCPSVKVVLKDIPERISQLHQRLIAQAKEEETNIPTYRKLFRECHMLQSEMSHLRLQLDTHKFTKEDFLSQVETARGHASVIYKVSVKGIGRAALKVAINPITPQTALDWKNEIDICRYQTVMQ